MMKQMIFLFGEELKKLFRSRYLYVFVAVSVLDLAAWAAEYSDRSRSVLYSAGVHVSGQGMEYLLNHEFGNFGVLVIYLLPLLLIAAPVFSDESTNKILPQILVTKNGRTMDVIVKTALVLLLQLIWTIVFSMVSAAVVFSLFDMGISGIGVHMGKIFKCVLNIWLGSFCLASVFLFVSSVMKNTISAMGAGFAVIIMPLFIESDQIWAQMFPTIGMQAECLLQRSNSANLLIWSFYVCVGILFIWLNLLSQKNGICMFRR